MAVVDYIFPEAVLKKGWCNNCQELCRVWVRYLSEMIGEACASPLNPTMPPLLSCSLRVGACHAIYCRASSGVSLSLFQVRPMRSAVKSPEQDAQSRQPLLGNVSAVHCQLHRRSFFWPTGLTGRSSQALYASPLAPRSTHLFRKGSQHRKGTLVDTRECPYYFPPFLRGQMFLMITLFASNKTHLHKPWTHHPVTVGYRLG